MAGGTTRTPLFLNSFLLKEENFEETLSKYWVVPPFITRLSSSRNESRTAFFNH